MINILIRNNGIDTLMPTADGGWHQGAVGVDSSLAASPTKVLEEAVYNSPSLLSDYKKVDVVADTERFILVPAVLCSDEKAVAEIVATLWPDASDEKVTVDLCGKVAFLSLFGKDLTGFVSRTFPSGRLHHRLATLSAYFMSRPRPVNRLKLYAHFGDDSCIDIIILNSDGPVMANSFKFEAVTDAIYYILAAVKDSGFDELDDEMIVCGDPQLCAEATETLRQYINSVMPLPLTVEDSKIALELLILKDENYQR